MFHELREPVETPEVDGLQIKTILRYFFKFRAFNKPIIRLRELKWWLVIFHGKHELRVATEYFLPWKSHWLLVFELCVVNKTMCRYRYAFPSWYTCMPANAVKLTKGRLFLWQNWHGILSIQQTFQTANRVICAVVGSWTEWLSSSARSQWKKFGTKAPLELWHRFKKYTSWMHVCSQQGAVFYGSLHGSYWSRNGSSLLSVSWHA